MVTKRYHYIFDASHVPDDLVNSREQVEKVLAELPSMLGMSILSGPNVVDGELINPGVSGFCIIDYSHISIHTFSGPKEALIDIFSCKPYDPKQVKQYLQESFRLKADHVNFFKVQYG